jgi:hypothetical protein
MRTLSIDVGVKNLAFIIFEGKTIEDISIEQWKVICITKENVNKIDLYILIEIFLKKLVELFPNDLIASIDHIIIEDQPHIARDRIKAIQAMLFSFFFMKKMELNLSSQNIQQQSPSLKLKITNNLPEFCFQNDYTESKSKYAANKKKGIEITEYVLQKLNKTWIDYGMTKLAGKPDMADSLLQGLYFTTNL